MFSGIIEAVVPAVSCEPLEGAFRLRLVRPEFFDDLKTGDSISVDGVCLTVESFDQTQISFVLAAETLKVLRWDPSRAGQRRYNLERSLRFGDRLHGHLVSGHVDSLAQVTRVERLGESLFIDARLDERLRPYVWHKGSLAINGVSLTLNSVVDDVVSVCLIPETQQRTNLGDFAVGDYLNIEPDLLARAVARWVETGWRPPGGPNLEFEGGR